ncbi:unnamed protein product [Rotaria sp. Silwood1]|nr:unnamed protein product [Rotaria sp. Silwood1]
MCWELINKNSSFMSLHCDEILLNEKNVVKYVNINTPLFIMVYLASDTNNDILIEKGNEYALELSICCQ